MRRVKQIMGMPISIDIPSATSHDNFNPAFERLRQIDRRFSPYRPGSELSRWINGKTEENELSEEFKLIRQCCEQARTQTNGYFSAGYSEDYDPSGYVKGWAIKQAGEEIEKQGYKTYCISAGGDILASSDSGKVWSIGIQDPHNRNKILNVLSISNGAVATSGNYERGAHIINPITEEPAKDFMSVTITGPDIIWADVLATAIFAMGQAGRDFIKNQPGYEAIIVD